ncbi:unnamed protein product [Clonostachys byssicola]|uniref:C2H2-type domain-containing protein n=1 Tax=Clonostachys byssicola TaxID=160290 RepID=A0A9N9U9X7_9HYPO|nr:unnamed protein product [Clonostachys byssicola]
MSYALHRGLDSYEGTSGCNGAEGFFSILEGEPLCYSQQNTVFSIPSNDGGNQDESRQAQVPPSLARQPQHGLSAESPSLSCPFYKYAPMRHWRCYRKYTFKRASDVKFHIQRVHLVGEHYCVICFKEFDNAQQLQDHNHIPDFCCLPLQGPERLFQETFDELARAMAHVRGSSDADKWYVMYRHIFPNASVPTSPYVSLTFDEPLAIMREHALYHERLYGGLMAELRRHGIPLGGIHLPSLQDGLINAALPMLANMVTPSPYERPVPITRTTWYDDNLGAL